EVGSSLTRRLAPCGRDDTAPRAKAPARRYGGAVSPGQAVSRSAPCLRASPFAGTGGAGRGRKVGVRTSLGEAFLQAIPERPEDDTPCLVSAAWLAEHGQTERADSLAWRTHLSLLLLEASDGLQRQEVEAAVRSRQTQKSGSPSRS